MTEIVSLLHAIYRLLIASVVLGTVACLLLFGIYGVFLFVSGTQTPPENEVRRVPLAGPHGAPDDDDEEMAPPS